MLMFGVALHPATRAFRADPPPVPHAAYDVLVMQACEQRERTGG